MSRLALGLMRINNMSVDEVEKLIIDCLNHDINFFDIADIYGGTLCETILGNVLKKNNTLRDKMYIQSKVGICYKTKGYDSSYDYIVNSVKESLERLNCGYLDCLLIHRPDIFMDDLEVSQAVKYLQDHHLIKDFGVSNFTQSEIEYLNASLTTKIKFNQVQLGIGNTTMLDQTMYANLPSKLASKEADSLFFFMKKEHITIQCWSPFQVGFFEGAIFDEVKYPKLNEVLAKYAQKYQTSKCAIASAFLFKLTKDLIVITGSTSFDKILEAKDGENINLTKEDWYKIYEETGHLLP